MILSNSLLKQLHGFAVLGDVDHEVVDLLAGAVAAQLGLAGEPFEGVLPGGLADYYPKSCNPYWYSGESNQFRCSAIVFSSATASRSVMIPFFVRAFSKMGENTMLPPT